MTPTAASWKRAGDVLACVVTADARDFELLRRYVQMDLEVVAEP